MSAQRTLAIEPFTQPVNGPAIALPGSKSITNRALLLAALSDGPVVLDRALFSRDSELMLRALEALGFAVEAHPQQHRMRITGHKGYIPAREATLHVGNAGTAARFLSALLCLRENGHYHVNGDDAMRERPMSGLLDALETQGAGFTYAGEPGHIPFDIATNGLPGGLLRLDARRSSQLLSALLMVAPFARTPLRIKLEGPTVSQPFVEMTLHMMAQFGYDAIERPTDTAYALAPRRTPYHLEASRYAVEPDATAASYFLALPIITGGSLSLPLPTHSLQGDTAFATVLQHMGLKLERRGNATVVSHPRGQKLHGIRANFNAISDTFLTLAAIAPLLEGPTRIDGIGHTRQQETDRIQAMATELRKLGQEVEEGPDWLSINPRPLQPATLDTYEDHRVAMSFGILGCHDLNGDGTPWLHLNNPDCCAKTFPNFFDTLASLHS